MKAGWSTPMLHVQSVEESIRFYRLLGFDLIDVEGKSPLGWARMHCEGGAVMFLRAEEPPPGRVMPMMLVMYTDDLPALREQLLENRIDVGKIGYPEHMPSGELFLKDPDGYPVVIEHWSEKEHSAWLARLKQKNISP